MPSAPSPGVILLPGLLNFSFPNIPKLRVLSPNQVVQTDAVSLILGWERSFYSKKQQETAHQSTASPANTPFDPFDPTRSVNMSTLPEAQQPSCVDGR